MTDVNDHAPEFQNVPYQLEVDEVSWPLGLPKTSSSQETHPTNVLISQLTPVGLTIFRSIQAIDRDKPNTANSDITYSIVVSLGRDHFPYPTD